MANVQYYGTGRRKHSVARVRLVAGEGNIIVNFENKPSKLVFELTKPVGEGNLVINNVKAYTNASIDKANFANYSTINTNNHIF